MIPLFLLKTFQLLLEDWQICGEEIVNLIQSHFNTCAVNFKKCTIIYNTEITVASIW